MTRGNMRELGYLSSDKADIRVFSSIITGPEEVPRKRSNAQRALALYRTNCGDEVAGGTHEQHHPISQSNAGDLRHLRNMAQRPPRTSPDRRHPWRRPSAMTACRRFGKTWWLPNRANGPLGFSAKDASSVA